MALKNDASGMHTLTLEVASEFAGSSPRIRSVKLLPVPNGNEPATLKSNQERNGMRFLKVLQVVCLSFGFLVCTISATEIEPTWELMAANYQVPEWFQDGKILTLDAAWQGPKPEFRNLQWIID